MAGMGSSWGRHTVRLPSLDGVPGPDSCWPPTPPPPLGTAAPRHRRPSAPRPPLSTAPAPQHREMANGWYGVELGAAYRAFAISRWGAGSGLLLATDIAPTPRHRTRHSAPPPLGTAPRPRHRPPPQHREIANGCYGVELGAAYRAFAISRWGAGSGLLLATDTAPAPQHRARPSAPGDGKWLVFGRAGGGIPCVCHLSVGCRFRTPAGHRHRARPSDCAPPSASRDGKWLVFGRDGGGIPCVCHLSAREPGGARVRDPVGPG